MTLYTLTGSGFNKIQANTLKTVLSTKEEIIVDKLFLNQSFDSPVILLILLKKRTKNKVTKNLQNCNSS